MKPSEWIEQNMEGGNSYAFSEFIDYLNDEWEIARFLCDYMKYNLKSLGIHERYWEDA